MNGKFFSHPVLIAKGTHTFSLGDWLGEALTSHSLEMPAKSHNNDPAILLGGLLDEVEHDLDRELTDTELDLISTWFYDWPEHQGFPH